MRRHDNELVTGSRVCPFYDGCSPWECPRQPPDGSELATRLQGCPYDYENCPVYLEAVLECGGNDFWPTDGQWKGDATT